MKNKIPDNINLEYRDCPISENSNDDILLKGTDRLNQLGGQFNVVQNKDSGLIRTNPRPDLKSMGYYYPDSYKPFQYSQKSTIKDDSNKRKWGIFNYNTKVIPDDFKKGKMLEIGCGSGKYLSKMKDKGWDVIGLEYSKTAAQNAQKSGLEVVVDSIEEAEFKENQFDIIVGWMVVEHLHDPILCFKKIRSWLKDDGYFVFSTPNVGSIEFQIFQDYWYALQVPTHTYLFEPKTITKLLNKTDFTVDKVYHQRIINNLISSLGLVFRDKLKLEKIGDWFLKFPHKNISIKRKIFYPISYLLSMFGQTGRMTVWAKKQ